MLVYMQRRVRLYRWTSDGDGVRASDAFYDGLAGYRFYERTVCADIHGRFDA